MCALIFSCIVRLALAATDSPHDARVPAAPAICMPIEPLVTELGVCVSVTGSFGSIFQCSEYFQFNSGLEQYLGYLDAVLLLASRTPVILVSTRTEYLPCGLVNSLRDQLDQECLICYVTRSHPRLLTHVMISMGHSPTMQRLRGLRTTGEWMNGVLLITTLSMLWLRETQQT